MPRSQLFAFFHLHLVLGLSKTLVKSAITTPCSQCTAYQDGLGKPIRLKVVYVLFKKISSNKVAVVVTILFRDSSSFPFLLCLLFYHAEFMTLFLILLGLKQNPGCRSNSGVKYSCDNPSTSTRHIVKCNQQADFSLFSAFFLGIFFTQIQR